MRKKSCSMGCPVSARGERWSQATAHSANSAVFTLAKARLRPIWTTSLLRGLEHQRLVLPSHQENQSPPSSLPHLPWRPARSWWAETFATPPKLLSLRRGDPASLACGVCGLICRREATMTERTGWLQLATAGKLAGFSSVNSHVACVLPMQYAVGWACSCDSRRKADAPLRGLRPLNPEWRSIPA